MRRMGLSHFLLAALDNTGALRAWERVYGALADFGVRVFASELVHLVDDVVHLILSQSKLLREQAWPREQPSVTRVASSDPRSCANGSCYSK